MDRREHTTIPLPTRDLPGGVLFKAIWIGRMVLIAIGALVILISALVFMEYKAMPSKFPDQSMDGIAIWAFMGILVVRFALVPWETRNRVGRLLRMDNKEHDRDSIYSEQSIDLNVKLKNDIERVVLFCTRCGSQLDTDHYYCPLCGKERQIDSTNDHAESEPIHETKPEMMVSGAEGITANSQVDVTDPDKDTTPYFQRTSGDTLMICATTVLVLSDQGLRVLFGDFYFMLLLVYTGDLLLNLILRAVRKINARILA